MSAFPASLFTASAGFESACQIDALPPGHRSRGLHGHSYLATIRAELPAGWAPFPGAEVSALRDCLERCIAPLDHGLLNTHIPQPTDENIARWIRQRLESEFQVPGITQVGIQSTSNSGVDLDANGHAHVWRRYRFQAAHQLPNVPMGHKCGRMHGHGFELILHANQDLWARLKPQLPELSWVTVYETGSSGANFDGERYRIWKEFTLDSAVQLNRAPADHPLAGIHGHTFTLRLHLSAALDQVFGWAMDFSDVKLLFDPIFKAMDHHPLHELAGLPDADTASLAAWVLRQAKVQLPPLERVDLYETRGSGVIVSHGPFEELIPV
jgi:6-pyruvoyltetrahydropterin/6-carboxytetrahydropterin synthase